MQSFFEIAKAEIPIIQAGMAGGITTPELVAAVSNTGALGTIGAGYMSETKLKQEIKKVKQLTDKPFAVNVFALNLESCASDVQEMQHYLNKYRQELGINLGKAETKVYDYLQEKIHVIIQEDVPIISTAFHVLPSTLIERLKQHDRKLIGMATNLEEAEMLEDAGYDMIVAQGYEAGGHRGTFDTMKYPNGSDIGLVSLLQSLVEHIHLPIIAAGGIHSKEQINGLMEMGASGVQLGTKFLMAKEAGTNNSYRRALMKAESTDTVITKVFTGRPARAIYNQFIAEMENSNVETEPFPIQNELTKDIRAAGKEFAKAEIQSLWAGQGVGAIKEETTVEEIIRNLT